MTQVLLETKTTHALASADEDSISIIFGWTVLIPRKKAVEYIQNWNTEPNIGFYEVDDRICLTHNSGKVMFSRIEAEAIAQLIKASYPEAMMTP